MDTKNSASRKGGMKTRIIVERVYGSQDMEEIFRTVNEQNTVRNIRAMMSDGTAEHGKQQVETV